MPYPDKLLAEDEEVVRHLHPHWLTLFWPVVRFLVIVGAASFGMGLVPGDPVSRRFRDVLGIAHQQLVADADEAWFTVAGRALRLDRDIAAGAR